MLRMNAAGAREVARIARVDVQAEGPRKHGAAPREQMILRKAEVQDLEGQGLRRERRSEVRCQAVEDFGLGAVEQFEDSLRAGARSGSLFDRAKALGDPDVRDFRL